MTHDEAFLQAISENPDDDAPRLLYADWLEERGDPRGEFIRVQCALARMDEYDPRRWDLAARERELLAAYQREWTRPCWWSLDDCGFRRGFLDWVTPDHSDFLKHGAELLRLGPAVEVRLKDGTEMLAEMLRRPFVQQLKRLAFIRGSVRPRLTATDVELLASSPALAGLTSLTFGASDIGPEGVRRLAQAQWLGGLRQLKLSGCEIGATGVEALAGCPALSRLECLGLSQNRLTNAAMQALADADSLTGLRRLELGYNEIDDAGARALAMNPHFANLEVLVLSGNPVQGRGGQMLAESPHLRRLTRLEMSNCQLGSVGVQALAQSPVVKRLSSLDLASNGLFAQGAAVVCRRRRIVAAKLAESGKQ